MANTAGFHPSSDTSSSSNFVLRPCSSRSSKPITDYEVFDEETETEEGVDEEEITSPSLTKIDDFGARGIGLVSNRKNKGKGSMVARSTGKRKGESLKDKEWGTGGSSSSSSRAYPFVSYSKQRQRRVYVGKRGSGGLRVSSGNRAYLEELALPLGMSFAAVIAQVLELKNIEGARIPADCISTTCIEAIKEATTSVYGDNFKLFLANFEKSFSSTLRTLKVVKVNSVEYATMNGPSLISCDCRTVQRRCKSEPRDFQAASKTRVFQENTTSHGDESFNEHKKSFNTSSTTSDVEIQLCQEDHVSHSFQSFCQSLTPRGCPTLHEETEEKEEEQPLYNGNSQLVLLHGQLNQQLGNISHTKDSQFNRSILSTFERSVTEQSRSNDLKEFEIGLTLKHLQLKQSQLDLSSYSHALEKIKISMGVAKSRFKEEKLKNQTQDFRHAELVRRCIDFLVAGLLIMSVCLGYGTWIYSYKRITEATAACTPSTKETNSWWVPKQMASFNSSWRMLRCHVVTLSRMSFGLMMILAIAYSLFQRSAGPVMPVTFILLVLGLICGVAGKLCIDTLGGSGYCWLLQWEALCLLHFFVNAFPSLIYHHLYGPVYGQGDGGVKLSYWIRRVGFYGLLLLILPMSSGLIPFASFSDWREHFIDLAFHREEY